MHTPPRAVDLAGTSGGTVHALHVVSDDLQSLVGGAVSTGALTERGSRAVETVERMADVHGVEAVTEIREGDPADLSVYVDPVTRRTSVVPGTPAD